MRVKIIRSHTAPCWYNFLIGSEFEVREGEDSYRVIGTGNGILKEHAQVIPDLIVNPIQPSHYNSGPGDLIDFALRHNIGPLEFNIFKYLLRSGRKDPTKTLEDLMKAKEYLDRLIQHHNGTK